jgi:hypothetical protein
MTLSIFSTQQVIDLCFMSVEELDKEIVRIALKSAEPITLSHMERDRDEELDRIKYIEQIKQRKLQIKT